MVGDAVKPRRSEARRSDEIMRRAYSPVGKPALGLLLRHCLPGKGFAEAGIERVMWLRLGAGAVIVALATSIASASTFTVDTSAFLNGGSMPASDAADACGGRNVSPPLRFSGAPAGARSLAVVVLDTDGAGGHGFVHWVAYGIDPGVRSIVAGFGSKASPAFTGGINDAGTQVYDGPCPPKGDPPHHYVFTVYALDLAPARLPPGLTRAALLRDVAPHRLAQAQVTGRFGR
jgi:hypothetical protein